MKRRLAWLLVFALLLPIAQAAASWHLLSHVHAQRSDRPAGHLAAHEDSCDRCLTTVALTGAAIPGPSGGVAPTMAPTGTVAIEHFAIWYASPQRPYESRAPPFARF